MKINRKNFVMKEFKKLNMKVLKKLKLNLI